MRILIIDKVHGLLPDGLRALGHQTEYLPEMTRGELLNSIAGFEGLVVRTKTSIDKAVLSNAVKLRFIARAGSGLDNVDTAWCAENGVTCFNSGEANADAVGEQTLGMLLSLHANIVKADREVRQGIWDREGNTGEELNGKTVAIIGYGNTGKSVARKLSGFGVNVLAHDKFLENYSDDFAQESSMEEIFEKADVVSFHVPLTELTSGMVNGNFIGKFRKPIYLLNLSRGKVVKTADLIVAMDQGKLKAAALDVIENENIADLNPMEREWFDKLKTSDRVILTPHIGGWTNESFRKISEVLLYKIKQLNPAVDRQNF